MMSESVGADRKNGLNGGDCTAGDEAIRARVLRSIWWCVTSGSNPTRRSDISPGGIAHTLSVCMVELSNMARGKDKGLNSVAGNALPTFVDIKLSAENRKRFADWFAAGQDPVRILTDFADTGYRVGCAWNGEQQSYTVSVTCRSSEQPNNGLCMTSFAKALDQAVCLAWFKHSVVACGAWSTYAPPEEQGFG